MYHNMSMIFFLHCFSVTNLFEEFCNLAAKQGVFEELDTMYIILCWDNLKPNFIN